MVGGNESCRPFHYRRTVDARLVVGLSNFLIPVSARFCAQNTDPVSIHFFFDTAWKAPLLIIVLAFFASGALLGVLSLLGTVFWFAPGSVQVEARSQNRSSTFSMTWAFGGIWW